MNFWEYNSDTFKSWLLSELKLDVSKQLQQWQEENPDELPFNSLFKGNETRIVIPFKSDPLADSIVKKLSSSGLQVDFDQGTIQDGKRAFRIGKYILNKKSPFTDQEKNWFVHQGDPTLGIKLAWQNEDYAIIVSRNPIDIARMSDHDGWTSCHAPGREYFQCALSDAKGAGAISYVVYKSDLQKIDDLQAPEIFRDRKRSITGVSPLSRLRLRKFVHKTEDYDLAVPEDRVYGEKISALETSVRDWALQNQANKFKERPRLKDFKLMGGSYQDNLASKLFNRFFGDDLDSGEAEYGGEDDDYENMAQQMQSEIDIIERIYRDNFEICNFYAEVEQDGEEPYVSYGGGFIIKIPDELLNDKSIRSIGDDKQAWKNVEYQVGELLGEEHIYNINQVDVNSGEIQVSLYSDNPPDPDGFRDFLETLEDIEKRKDELSGKIYHLFVELGIAKDNSLHQIVNNEDHSYQFKYFTWEDDSRDATVMVYLNAGIPLDKTDPVQFKNIGYPHHYGVWMSKFIIEAKKQVFDWAKKIHDRQPSLFSRYEDYPFASHMTLFPDIKIQLSADGKAVEMKMSITFNYIEKAEDTNEAIELIRFIDNNYNKFGAMMQNIYLKLKQEFTSQTNFPNNTNQAG